MPDVTYWPPFIHGAAAMLAAGVVFRIGRFIYREYRRA